MSQTQLRLILVFANSRRCGGRGELRNCPFACSCYVKDDSGDDKLETFNDENCRSGIPHPHVPIPSPHVSLIPTTTASPGGGGGGGHTTAIVLGVLYCTVLYYQLYCTVLYCRCACPCCCSASCWPRVTSSGGRGAADTASTTSSAASGTPGPAPRGG